MSCVSQNARVPDDFTVRMDEVSVQPGAGNAFVLLEATDDGTFLLRTSEEGPARARIVPREYVEKIYHALLKANVFRLRDRYEDLSISDGATSYLYVRANGTEKRITFRNASADVLSDFSTEWREMVKALPTQR